jgi:cobalt/nickel transport system permease protein
MIIMHIGDGLIPLWQTVIYWIIAVGFIVMALRWAHKEMDERMVPMLAVLAAGIFAIQAMNIPIPWGTSGHMVGAVMASIIIGSPWAGVILITLVLIVQGVLFGDGGITTMGANIINMGVISGFLGFYVYQVMRKTNTGISIAAFIGAWAGIFIAAEVCAIEMWIAGTFPLVLGLTWMGIYHAVIGVVGEGIITAVVVTAIASARPDLMPQDRGVAA